MANSKKNEQNSLSQENQVQVLRTMSPMPIQGSNIKQYQINEIAEMSGLGDEREIQRTLFILEGHKLVAPFPKGDFTSKTWHITDDGLKAIKSINKSPAMAARL